MSDSESVKKFRNRHLMVSAVLFFVLMAATFSVITALLALGFSLSSYLFGGMIAEMLWGEEPKQSLTKTEQVSLAGSNNKPIKEAYFANLVSADTISMWDPITSSTSYKPLSEVASSGRIEGWDPDTKAGFIVTEDGTDLLFYYPDQEFVPVRGLPVKFEINASIDRPVSARNVQPLT